jgi:hypothetical protein
VVVVEVTTVMLGTLVELVELAEAVMEVLRVK